MQEIELKINTGIYLLKYLTWELKLTVNYANKSYSYQVENKDEITTVMHKKLEDYAQNFAKKMIESKSDRNFYSETNS